MSNKNDEKGNSQSAKVIKLGFNISVSGDPDTDFEVVLDDEKTKGCKSIRRQEQEVVDLYSYENSSNTKPGLEYDKINPSGMSSDSTDAMPKHSKTSQSSLEVQVKELENSEDLAVQEISLLNKIKTTMEHFEKFSDHIKEIPRLRNNPLSTSTPLSHKHNSKSESSLLYSDYRPKKYSYLYDYNLKKDYFRGSVKLPDLFLKPLPAEGYYKRGIYSRYFDLEPYRHYGSDNSLNKTSDCKSICEKMNYDCDIPSESPSGILKKSDYENGDKQSTSSADSIKDIKIYQSGGILIMQNFKDNFDVTEKKELSEFSAKLIENCNKLKMEANSFLDDKSPDENKASSKTVQFDLSSIESQKSKSGDSSSNLNVKDESSSRLESSESTSDCLKNKDTSPHCTSQSQDFPSISTQENDSIISNQPGLSPTCASSKKLEWDSGADIGYLNLDLTKENLSTIEKIVLKGLSSDGTSEKNVVYEKKPELNLRSRSKFILERKPSDEMDDSSKSKSEGNSAEGRKESKVFGENEKKSKKFLTEAVRRKIFENNLPEGATKGTIQSDLDKPELIKTKSPIKLSRPESVSKNKPYESSDKSINVNTLFETVGLQTPQSQTSFKNHDRRSESPSKLKYKKSPKLNVIKNKKPSLHRSLKVSKKNPVNAKLSKTFEMRVPRNTYKKIEAVPIQNDVELSREIDHIIIDQRFKIKQGTGRDFKQPDKDNAKETKTKNTPISASSSSNNTVLPKPENNVKDSCRNIPEKIEFEDQVIQTSDYDCTSVGIQAFSSQVSSDCEAKSYRKVKTKEKEIVNTSTKNIQAFGLNASLPKQLEHPRGTETVDHQNTKSTQFFGGPLNSLPNYHSNLNTKPTESCGRVPRVLKVKKNSETENILVKEENEKNILANDTVMPTEPKTDSGKRVSRENKENLISTNSRSQSSASQKNSKEESQKESDLSQTKAKKKTPSLQGSDCPNTSDEISSMVLTSEVLKVHGDCIDRNIIQEKYFQSQLVELEKKKKVSKSTSMEFQVPFDNEVIKEYTNTGCQYSPPSKETITSEELENDSYKANDKKASLTSSNQNLPEDNFEMSKSTNPNSGAGDSAPSSTQTAHSWVPGIQNPHESTKGHGRARSFEYLPGHIYESSGNLREKLPSETEQNLITSSSDSDTAKGSISEGDAKDSEGRNTLILENSTEASHDSDRMKILDETLAQLDLVVLKLRKKDSQMQDVTQSLLKNLWKTNGSGDSALGKENSFEMNLNNKDSDDSVKRQSSSAKVSESNSTKGKNTEKEYSIACQTELKSPNSDKLFEDRKALAKRISEEKKSQIKWIENEIHHLNILRQLLERQSSPTYKKKSPFTMNLSEESKSEENCPTLQEIRPQTVTPVYGCTISLTENPPLDGNQPEECPSRIKEPCSSQYRMAMSLSGCSKNWRRVVMLPVGLQVSLNNDSSLLKECLEEGINTENSSQRNFMQESNTYKPTRSDICTQCPSSRRDSENQLSASVQTNFPSHKKSSRCTQSNCFCINLSDFSSSSASRSSKKSGRRDSSKLRFLDEESCIAIDNKTSNTTDPDTGDIDNYSESRIDKVERRKSLDERWDLSENHDKCKSILSTNCKCQKSESSGSYTKHISIQTANCKCSSKRGSSTVSKSNVSCRKSCQSNIYINHDKATEELGVCRCSKIHVQKTSNCTCHIIKIHGPKCCSTESSPCSCKKQIFSKKTDQFCQTEDCADKPEQEVKKPLEHETVVEKKTSFVKKFPCDPKIGYEFLCPEPDKLVVEEKERVEKKVPCKNIPSKLNCGYRKPAVPNTVENDDFPRHYFLKIREEEVDDEIFESKTQKKSLEVVTVTVPVKKAGKSKIYGSNVSQTRETATYPRTSFPIRCNCCAECIQNCGSPNENYRKINTRPAEARIENSGNVQVPQNYKNYAVKEPPSAPAPRQRNPQEFYQARSGANLECEPPSAYYERPTNDCYGMEYRERFNYPFENVISSKNIQNEYDSHKKNRNSEFYNCGEKQNFYKETRQMAKSSGSKRFVGERDFNSRQTPTERFSDDTDECGQEYYNYNKREFMTKSEILKEEEQKRKTAQPSLQECLSSNRPDFYNSAERRRQIILERSKARAKNQNNKMECLLKMMQKCNEESQNPGPNRIFTTVEMREQTMKRYKKLPEVTGKIADQKKKEEYRANRLMADVFAKKLQIEALKGHINLSNSVSVLYTV